jgi:hypothetical protein
MAEEDGRRVNASSHEPTSYEPGQFVRHPGAPDWGLGQVQSVAGHRVTVNFAEAGKVLVNTAIVALDVVDAS